MTSKLLFTNLTAETTTDELKNLLQAYGRVTDARKVADKKSSDRSIIFVDMILIHDISYILKAKHFLNERPIYVNLAESDRTVKRKEKSIARYAFLPDFVSKSGRTHFYRARVV